MIYPSRRFHWVVLCAGLPGIITATLVSAAIIPLVCAAAVFSAIALLDALACRNRSSSLKVIVPPYSRMYRGILCRMKLCLTSHAPIKGQVLECGRTELLFSAPVSFSCTRESPTTVGEAVVIPITRGQWPLVSLQLRVESPLLMWRRVYYAPVKAEAHVFANNKTDLHVLCGLPSGALSGIHLQQTLGKGREVDKLREYVQGDGMEDIHWKATARHGRPITKEYRLERSQSIYVVIDSSRSSKRVVDHLTIDGHDAKLPVPLIERSLIAADMLSMIAVRQSDRIGLAAFDCRVRLFIKPGTGAHHLVMCRNALVNLQSSTEPADYCEMFQFLATNIRRRAMILILADFDDPNASENYAAHVHLLARNHAVMGVCPVAGDVQPLFSHPVVSQDRIYDALSGHLKWRGVQKMRYALRARGTEIVTSSPRDLPARTIEAYVTMKQRQRV
jgi:uncharacterized protein (DUF58 family)